MSQNETASPTSIKRYSGQNEIASSTKIERYSECCLQLIEASPEDVNCIFSAKLQQFHLYARHKLSATENVKTRFTYAEIYKMVVKKY